MRGARTKAFRLEAVKDASGQVPGAADDSAPKIYKFKASDGDWDHYQDRLSIQGWKLETFNANPIILHNHDAGDGGWLGLSRKDVLPIGRGRVYVEGDALMVDIEFDQDDEFARRVEGKVAKGMLNAVSVRYLMKKYRENERGGYDSDEQELLEISVVTIPGNARATIAKARPGGMHGTTSMKRIGSVGRTTRPRALLPQQTAEYSKLFNEAWEKERWKRAFHEAFAQVSARK